MAVSPIVRVGHPREGIVEMAPSLQAELLILDQRAHLCSCHAGHEFKCARWSSLPCNVSWAMTG
jgi:hypothetical protein